MVKLGVGVIIPPEHLVYICWMEEGTIRKHNELIIYEETTFVLYKIFLGKSHLKIVNVFSVAFLSLF